MTTNKVRARAAVALDARKAPREFKLWEVGPNGTDYGVHVWTERSAREVLKRYEARGNPILLDIEHKGATLEDGTPAPTAGYARLEVRAGAPWLVFDWSDFGREQIETGQRRFLSAEYDVDKVTGEIVAVYRVSLVADPGTHNARMLAGARTSQRAEGTHGKGRTMQIATKEDIDKLTRLTSEAGIIRWASSQPRKVVLTLIESLGGADSVQARGLRGRGLEGRDLVELQRAMGTYDPRRPIGPHVTDNGRKLVLPSTPPSVYRAHAQRGR